MEKDERESFGSLIELLVEEAFFKASLPGCYLSR